jgi:hypothetical protein
MKKALIVVVVIIVVVVVVAVGYIARNKDKIVDMALDRGFGTVESLVLQSKPDSISEDSVRVIFSAAMDRVRNGEVDARKMQSTMLLFQGCMEDKHLDSLEVMTILEEMKNL